jgi:hypothetical protein
MAGGCSKSDGGVHAAIALGREQGQPTAERMSSDRNAVGVDTRQLFQERQTGDHVIQVVGGEQTKLQTLSSFFSVRHFLALQIFLHEITLICRESFTASKR